MFMTAEWGEHEITFSIAKNDLLFSWIKVDIS